MAQVYGSEYSREQLLQHVGDISQVARVMPVRRMEGREDQLHSIEVYNASGLEFSVLAGRGLDIASARFCGCSLAWLSPTGETHPAYFDHEGENGTGWLRSFYGGLVTTCGLTYAGAAGKDGDRMYGLHGRAANTPAYNVAWKGEWQGNDYLLTVEGRIREAVVFGENLELHRTITTKLGSNVICINDKVANLGYQTTEHMMLYHINVGFPLVTKHSYLVSPSTTVMPRDAEAVIGLETAADFHEPSPGYKEKVYFHSFPADMHTVQTAIVNPLLPVNGLTGLALAVRFQQNQLPRFIEWKMMGQGAYVVGMEPANCLVFGRSAERDSGGLQNIEPGEIRSYNLELEIIAGQENIAALSQTRAGR